MCALYTGDYKCNVQPKEKIHRKIIFMKNIRVGSYNRFFTISSVIIF